MDISILGEILGRVLGRILGRKDGTDYAWRL